MTTKTSTPQPAAAVKASKAEAVREYLAGHPRAKNQQVADALEKKGVSVGSGYVSQVRSQSKRKRKSKAKTKPSAKNKSSANASRYPRHPLKKALRIPQAILDQNAGRECSEKEAAAFVGVGLAGPFRVEISSAIKFGLVERPSTGRIKPTKLAKKILRPQSPDDELSGLREAALKAPEVSKVYGHYRGENLPDKKFFDNALVETFGIPRDKTDEFTSIFQATLEAAELLEKHQGKTRVLDISDARAALESSAKRIKELGKDVKPATGDTCFVMMPFAAPHGEYYSKIYEPAIIKAGLSPVRADTDIFGTGKIMDQIWSGLNAAKVLVAELTTRNPNVFYELGLAHALEKPVVLVSSNETDVPFDLHHIRVIYYDVMDPFWGQKLMDKVAENILSALKNPEEAIFKRVIEETE